MTTSSKNSDRREARSNPEVERGQFQNTRWSLVVKVKDATEGVAHRALSKLCEMYWFPLYAFVRRKGANPDDAEDLTQGFFAYNLERGLFDGADRERGKLRSYLMRAMQNYMHNRREYDQADKRGGKHKHLSIDQEIAEQRYAHEPADELTPDVVFERHWVLNLLEHARRRLEQEHIKRGKGDLFLALRGALSKREPERPYAKVAPEFDMSVDAVKKVAQRMRERYREIVEEEISHTLQSPDEVDAEIRHLFSVFSNSTPSF